MSEGRRYSLRSQCKLHGSCSCPLPVVDSNIKVQKRVKRSKRSSSFSSGNHSEVAEDLSESTDVDSLDKSEISHSQSFSHVSITSAQFEDSDYVTEANSDSSYSSFSHQQLRGILISGERKSGSHRNGYPRNVTFGPVISTNGNLNASNYNTLGERDMSSVKKFGVSKRIDFKNDRNGAGSGKIFGTTTIPRRPGYALNDASNYYTSDEEGEDLGNIEEDRAVRGVSRLKDNRKPTSKIGFCASVFNAVAKFIYELTLQCLVWEKWFLRKGQSGGRYFKSSTKSVKLFDTLEGDGFYSDDEGVDVVNVNGRGGMQHRYNFNGFGSTTYESTPKNTGQQLGLLQNASTRRFNASGNVVKVSKIGRISEFGKSLLLFWKSQDEISTVNTTSPSFATPTPVQFESDDEEINPRVLNFNDQNRNQAYIGREKLNKTFTCSPTPATTMSRKWINWRMIFSWIKILARMLLIFLAFLIILGLLLGLVYLCVSYYPINSMINQNQMDIYDAPTITMEQESMKESLKDKIALLEAQIEKMAMEQTILKSIVKTTMNKAPSPPQPIYPPPKVDVEELKASILPEVLKNIESLVKISCKTNCPEGPEGVVVGGSDLTQEKIEMLIQHALSKYDADKTGKPDLALEPAGGSIVSTRCTKSSKVRNSVISLWGIKIWSPPNSPRKIIQPGVVPGECWSFEGSIGFVVIKLVYPAVITGFTMEHIPKTISPYGNIATAPNKFQVVGLHGEYDLDTAHDFGNFTYEDNGNPIQYFSNLNASNTPFPMVELKILSNHGNLHHTCLYRFRVHGNLAKDGTLFTATAQGESDSTSVKDEL